MKKKEIICGFSKLTREQKLDYISQYTEGPSAFAGELSSYRHSDPAVQKLFDEFSENTLTNYFIPYGVAPNFLIDGKVYHVPMVIEESSVVAAAAKSAKFWSDKGGFTTRVKSVIKTGQVHFFWNGDAEKLFDQMPLLRERLLARTAQITANMRQRGGGIRSIDLVDKTHEIPDYYQIHATFDTVDSMGANFINSCLEEFAEELRQFFRENPYFTRAERKVEVVMSILSNYTPDCLVEASIECDIDRLNDLDEGLTGKEFAGRFQKAVQIAQVDTFRAATHNKGIFNGIDALALATGNDFRALEANGHVYAARSGKYRSLTDISISGGKFRYSLTIPMAMGTVGGLTALHPLAKRSLELLGNPDARQLMRIAASVGLANNFAALKSLVTKGIQRGHMKMHLLNILNNFGATEDEKVKAKEYFAIEKVTFRAVELFLEGLREQVLSAAPKVIFNK
ncbi:MAG: hydroxymethylglutaryl-CoA reductase [Bacteroidales bacterium]|nr:hydroxymethylglutaryl-CoA reductase [Bacteroidales bacterium]